jgi:hypothetical protein
MIGCPACCEAHAAATKHPVSYFRFRSFLAGLLAGKEASSDRLQAAAARAASLFPPGEPLVLVLAAIRRTELEDGKVRLRDAYAAAGRDLEQLVDDLVTEGVLEAPR